MSENDSIIFGGDGSDVISNASFVYGGLLFGGNGDDTFNLNRFGNYVPTENKIYIWGGEGGDKFIQSKLTTAQTGNWVMDFNSHKPSEGVDTIDYNYFSTSNEKIDHVWDPVKTQLLSHTADANHPFLSDGATYYELQVQSSINSNDPNWYSVLNLVGTNVTLDGLFANENLV